MTTTIPTLDDQVAALTERTTELLDAVNFKKTLLDTSAQSASDSATAAATSATNAATSETNAATSAATASGAQAAVAASASTASTAATNASTSATNAANSQTAAATSATNASTSATNAATSETNALVSSNSAKDWATKTTAEVVVGQGYGAKKYANDAAASATNAANSQAAAATSATTASSGATTSQSNLIQTLLARDAAITASQVASAATEMLAARAQQLHVGNVVATYIGDVGRDSDPNWIKRMLHTSWYNETICTGSWLGQVTNELAARGDNLMANPEDLTAASWTATNKNGSISAFGVGVKSPSGAILQLHTENTTAAVQRAEYQPIVVTAGVYAASFEFKDNGRRYASIYPQGTAQAWAVFDLQTGTITSTGGTNYTSSSIVSLGAGVYRCTVVFQSTAGTANINYYLSNSGVTQSPNYTGDGISGIYVGAAKLNQVGMQLSSYNGSSELVSNGSFTNSTNGYTTTNGASQAVSSGSLTITGVTVSTVQGSYTPITCVIGQVYSVNLVVASFAGSNRYLRITSSTDPNGTQQINMNPVVGTNTVSFVATATTHYIHTCVFTTGDTLVVTSISAKQVTTFATAYVPYSQIVGNFFQNSTDGKFYMLNATYGVTEVFRGNKREFPALFAAIIEANKLVIYDLTAAGCPMWMVFSASATANWWNSSSNITALTYLNGKLIVGASASGLRVADFLADTLSIVAVSGTNVPTGGIATRNNLAAWITGTRVTIVNNNVTAVAATVASDAPVDLVTGLPVPTIAVGTSGTPNGVSVIKNDGTVSSPANTFGTNNIGFDLQNNAVFIGENGRNIRKLTTASGYTTVVTATGLFGLQGTQNVIGKGLSIQSKGLLAMLRYTPGTSTPEGYFLLKENYNSMALGMAAAITNSFNTGWMVGDNRGCFLCDTVAETITASGELVPNGTFTPDTSGWTPSNSATLSVVAGAMRMTNTTPGVGQGASQTIATTTGKKYSWSMTVVTNSSGKGYSLNIGSIPAIDCGAVRTYSGTFIATAASTTFAVTSNSTGAPGEYLDIDNISFKEVGGVNLILNPTFDVDASNWTLASGASVSGGTLNFDGTTSIASGTDLAKSNAFTATPGKQYAVTYTITGSTANDVSLMFFTDSGATALAGVTRTAPGTYTEYFTAHSGTTASVSIRARTSTGIRTGGIDNVEVRDAQNLILNPTFDVDASNWTASNNGTGTGAATIAVVSSKLRVTCNGQGNPMAVQTIGGLTVGHTYQLSADLDKGTSATATLQIMSPNIFANNTSTPANASITFVATATSVQVSLQSTTNTNGQYSDFDNVVLTDVTELVQNGQFEGLNTGWTPNTAGGTNIVSNGAVVITNPSVAGGNQYQTTPITTVAGRTYVVSADCTGASTYVGAGTAATSSTNLGAAFLTATGKAVFQFVATGTTTYIGIGVNTTTASQAATFDNVSCQLASPDRSSKAKGGIINGSLVKSSVSTGSQLVWFSGWSASNFWEKSYTSDLDFGTGDFYVMGWAQLGALGSVRYLAMRGKAAPAAGTWAILQKATGEIGFYAHNGTSFGEVASSPIQAANALVHISVQRSGSTVTVSINGVQSASATFNSTLTDTSATFRLGNHLDGTAPFNGSLALWRTGATAPSADQIAQIYRDETAMFQPGALVTMDGTSNSIVGLGYEDLSDILHVETSWGRTGMHYLVRVDSSASQVGTGQGVTAGSGVHVTYGSTSARFTQPSLVIREELRRLYQDKKAAAAIPKTFWFTGDGTTTAFTLPYGWTLGDTVIRGGLDVRGSGFDYTVGFDGYRWTVTFVAAPANNSNIGIQGVRNV